MDNHQGQHHSDINETLVVILIVLAALSYSLTLFPGFIAPTLINLNYMVDSSWLSFLSGVLNIIFEPNYTELKEYYYQRKEADFLMVWGLNNRIAIPTTGIAILVYFTLNVINNIKLKRAIISTAKLSLEDLIRLQVQDCHYMRPVAIENRPDKTDLIDGRWARAMKPYEFLEYYNISTKKGSFNKDIAEEVLRSQLAHHVRTIDDIYQWANSSKILLCILVYRIMIMRYESNELIDQSGKSWRLNKETNIASFDNSQLIEKIDKILRSKKFVKVLNALLVQHGYANTLLLGAFNQARINAGKISTPEFIWLKPMNRVLFYALNQLGRKEAWIESVAVTAHFQVELHDKKANYKPQIAPAMTVVEKLSYDKYEEMLKS